MIKNKTHIILIFLFLIFFSCQKTNKYPTATNGILVINEIPDNKIIPLDGEWEFYWKQFLKPENFETYKKDTVKFVYANSIWNKYIIDNKKIGNFGFGTYHLKICIPKGEYGFKIKRIETAYELWVDDKKITQNGVIGKDKNTSIPFLNPQIVFFEITKDTTDIVILVSNFHHREGGFKNKLYIGQSDTIFKNQTKNLLSTYFIFGGFFIIAVYFLFQYIFLSKNGPTPLFLSLTIFLSIIFSSIAGEVFLTKVFHTIPWEIIKKIDFISNFGRIVFFLFFINSLFREDRIFSKKVYLIILYSYLIYIILILVTPAKIYSFSLYPFLIITFTSVIYIIIKLIILSLSKRKRHLIILIGLIVLFVTFLNDILSHANVINTPFTANLGLFVFIFFNSIVLALSISTADRTSQKFTELWGTVNLIRNKLTDIKSFDIGELLKIISIEISSTYTAFYIKHENNITCQSIFNENEIKTANLAISLESKLENKLFDEIVSEKIIIRGSNFLVFPLKENNELKAIIYIETENKIKKTNIEMFDMLQPDISTMIDNYVFYHTLDLINSNLENIIQKRINTINKQKEQLIEKTVILDQKVEELNISNQLVDELNTDLLELTTTISRNNNLLKNKNEEIISQNEIIQNKLKSINSSLFYANYIQNTILNIYHKITNLNYFEYNVPKNIVGGDFWIFNQIADNKVIALIDCTGQNVSSAFLTIFLQSLFDELFLTKNQIVLNPKECIEFVSNNFHTTLTKFSSIKDDFKIFYLVIDAYNNLTYSGDIPAFIIRKNKIIELEVDKTVFMTSKQNLVNNNNFLGEKKDIIYLQTDGFFKQIHKGDLESYGKERYFNLLININNKDFSEQKNILKEEFENWKKDISQIDDFLALGFALS